MRWPWTKTQPLSHTERFFIASVSPVELPPHAPVRRIAPRPLARQGDTYQAQFDDTHLFYDVFEGKTGVVMTGPALRNLAPLLEIATATLDGASSRPIQTRDIGNVSISSSASTGLPQRMLIDLGWADWDVAVQPSHAHVFKDRKVLATISKDNHLKWIADWAEFHVRMHGADAVLFYDNGSSRYGPEDILSTLRAVPGIEAAIVVPWPYKFGPAGNVDGSDWDSRLAQPVMLEHARRRFLRDAAAMVNLDIDELVVAEEGVRLFDRLAASKSGAISYRGRWIEPLRSGGWWQVRHRYFRHYVASDQFYLSKWAAIPSRLPDTARVGVHEIVDFDFPFAADDIPQIVFRHFRAVGLNWKYNRHNKRRWSRNRLRVDETWVRAMQEIGWSR